MGSRNPGKKHTCEQYVRHCETERAHIETVLMQRFNYFIVFFGIVLVGAGNIRDHFMRAVLLTLACTVCWMIALTLSRAQDKLDAVFEELRPYDWHPAIVSDIVANRRGPSRRALIGRTIPWTCVVVLAVAILVSLPLGICSCGPHGTTRNSPQGGRGSESSGTVAQPPCHRLGRGGTQSPAADIGCARACVRRTTTAPNQPHPKRIACHTEPSHATNPLARGLGVREERQNVQ